MRTLEKWILIIITLVFITLCMGLIAFVASAEPNYTDEAIVNAIFIAEGGYQATYLYGIRSVSYADEAEARRICFNTVRNNRKRFADWGYKTHATYLEFLASRYCPTTGKLSPAEKRLNGNWLKNVKANLKGGK